MPYSEDMRTLAEIAIALAGFAGVVLAIRSRRAIRDQKVNQARLRELLVTSFIVVFFAFFPPLMTGVLGDSPWAWRGPMLIFALAHLAALLSFMLAVGKEGSSDFSLAEWLSLPGAAVVIFLQFATAFGNFPDYVPEIYLLALLWFLLIAAMNFGVLLIRDDGSETETPG